MVLQGAQADQVVQGDQLDRVFPILLDFLYGQVVLVFQEFLDYHLFLVDL